LVPLGLALVAGVFIGLWGAQILRRESPAHEVAGVQSASAAPLQVRRLSWVEQPAPFSAAHVAAVGARLVAIGGKDGADGAWYSDDSGESWASATLSRGSHQADWQLGPFASDGAHLVSLGSRPAAATGNDADRISVIFTSDDRGASWDAIEGAMPPDIHGETVGVAFGAGGYVAVINPVTTTYTLRPEAWTSTDGVIWNRVETDAFGSGYVDGVAGGGRIVAIGSAVTRDSSTGVATAWWSEDGTDWHAVRLGETDATLAVTAAPPGFVAAGRGSDGGLVVWTSTDGTAWIALPSNVQDWDQVTDVAAGSMGIVVSGTTRGVPPAPSLAFIPRQGGPATVANDIQASPQFVTALPRRFVAFGPICPPRALCSGDPGQSMMIGTPESAETTPAPQASGPMPTWQEPADYSFDVSAQCGERFLIGDFHVEVHSHAVTSVTGLDERSRAMNVGPDDVPTIAQMLDRAEQASNADGGRVAISREGDGRPSSVSIDWKAQAIDDEECYSITGFKLTAP
jgi:hypothetical protein